MTTSFADALADVLAFTPEAFTALGANLKPEWFLEALAAVENGEDKGEMRRRKLPVDRALWLTIGMGLFRDRSIQEVVEHLDLSLLDLVRGPALRQVRSLRLVNGLELRRC